MTDLFNRKYCLYISYPEDYLSPVLSQDQQFRQQLFTGKIDGDLLLAKSFSFDKVPTRWIKIEDLQIEANVSSDRDSSTDTNITLYNLSLATRNLISKDSQIVLQAGYENQDHLSTIMSGQVTRVDTIKNNQDRKTKIFCRDSYVPYNNLRVSKTYINKSRTEIILDLTQLAADGGLPTGHIILEQQIPLRGFTADLNTPLGFYSVEGLLLEEIKKFCEQISYKAYTVNGNIYIEPKYKPQLLEVFQLTSDNLVGDIEPKDNSTESEDGSGIKFKVLLNGNIRVGKKVQVFREHEKSGSYNITKVEHKLNFEGNNWFTEVEADNV